MIRGKNVSFDDTRCGAICSRHKDSGKTIFGPFAETNVMLFGMALIGQTNFK